MSTMVLHPLDLPSSHGRLAPVYRSCAIGSYWGCAFALGQPSSAWDRCFRSAKAGWLANSHSFSFAFAWHLTSVTWAVLALILIQLVRDAVTARWWAAASTGVVFTAVGLFDAIYSRGRHAGWPLPAGIGLAALLSLA